MLFSCLAAVDEAVEKYRAYGESLLLFGLVDLGVTTNLAKKKPLQQSLIALTKYRLYIWPAAKIKKLVHLSFFILLPHYLFYAFTSSLF